MKFGQIEQNQLDVLELSLPEDHSGTQQILKKYNKDQQIRVFTGCGKWGREEWVGNIFPEGTKPKDYLKEYINHFNSVELNSTFYSINKSNLVSWAETANGKDFRFCPKFPRRISHIKRLKEVEDLTDYFVESCLNFGNNLGPAFLQMPDNFAPKYLDKLAVYLEKIPDEFPMQIELRHQDWYKEPAFTEVHDLLQGLKKGFVITDTAGRRDVIHQRLTNPVAFIRFNGYGIHETDFANLNGVEADEEQFKLSKMLVDNMTKKFDDIKLEDRYNDALKEVINTKIEGKEIVSVEEEEPEVVDIMTALQKSIAQAKDEKKPMKRAEGDQKEEKSKKAS